MDFWEYNEHNIDDKGRLVLPASFRSAFESGGLLTYHGRYLALFEYARWEAHLRTMRDSGNFSPQELRYLKSFVTEFTPDGQHRVTVPTRLRDRAGIDREVALIGMGDHVAVYARDVWKAFEEELDSGGDLADRLAEAL
ncbi:MAG: hypothetical protein M9942_06400 [Microthrixaceae bacterium]|nr:hypothetical protein [Microthrixaceae bacterium]MCO5318054.1 hypothetical protein [Microthrixaceae bacterium]